MFWKFSVTFVAPFIGLLLSTSLLEFIEGIVVGKWKMDKTQVSGSPGAILAAGSNEENITRIEGKDSRLSGHFEQV